MFIHSPSKETIRERERREGYQKSRITATTRKMQEQQQHEGKSHPHFTINQIRSKGNETRTKDAIRRSLTKREKGAHTTNTHLERSALSLSHFYFTPLPSLSALLSLWSVVLALSLFLSVCVSSFSCVCQPQQRSSSSSRRKGFSICCRHK